MAQSKNNIITHGMSGMIGDMLVFRQRGGKTIVSNKPKESNKPPTAQQVAVQTRFQQAIIYGKSSIDNPVTKQAYGNQAKEGQSAFNVAVADFFSAPDIAEIDVSQYHGKVGDTIRIKVTDDFMVKGVHIKIENPDTSLVEEGEAVVDSSGLNWHYTATKDNADIAGDKITVTAKDIPENSSVKNTTLA